MPKLQFIGRVLPEPIELTVPWVEAIWKWPEFNLEPIFRVTIHKCVVRVECEIEKYEPDYLSELHRRAFDLARASANLAAFAGGFGVTVTLDTLIDPAGRSLALVFSDPSLSPLCTAFGLGPDNASDFNAMLRMVAAKPPLFMALNDLIAAITVPHCSLVNCGRVIETIRRMIAPTLEGPAAWKAMHRALNVSRPYQEWISKQSIGPRHAVPGFIPGTITTEVTRRTWNIMNRFLEYGKRGNKPLTAPDFPELIESDVSGTAIEPL